MPVRAELLATGAVRRTVVVASPPPTSRSQEVASSRERRTRWSTTPNPVDVDGCAAEAVGPRTTLALLRTAKASTTSCQVR